MAKKTYLQLVNSVLKRLREDTVATVAENPYSTLIAELVNDAKRHTEDAWDWSRLFSTIDITTSAGTTQYAITGAGERFRFRDRHNRIWNDTEEIFMYPKPLEWILRHLRDASVTNEIAHFYAIDGIDSSGDPTISIYPPPNGTNTLNVDLIVPQADLSADGDTLNVPWYPVYLRAYALAISERGEDSGVGFSEADLLAENSLRDAIAQDVSLQRDQLILEVE